MMARGMRTLTGAGTTPDAWRRFFEPSDVVGIKVNCGGYPFCVSAYEIVAEVVRQLMGIGVPVSQIYVYERFQNQLDEVNYAPHLPAGVQIVAAERANRNVDNSGYDPATYLEADLFGEEDTRSNMMRLVSQPPDEDHQHPEHEGPRRHRRHRVPEEHRLRQLLQRRAHAPGRQVAHLFGRRHAGSGRAPALEDGAADHGRPARRVARRSVRENHALRVLPAPDPVRHRSGGDRSPAARHHRGAAPRARRDLDLGPLARLAEDRRHARARCRSQRQHHHPRAGPRGVRVDARPRRVRSRRGSRCRTSRYDGAPAARRFAAVCVLDARASRRGRRSRRRRSSGSAWRPSAPMPGGLPVSR